VYVGAVLYGRGGRVGNRLRDVDFGADEDGRFEIRISTEEQPGTWLSADGDENAIIVRQYFADRAKEGRVDLRLELVGEPAPPAPLDPKDFAIAVERSGKMLRSIFERTIAAWRMASKAALNRFVEIPAEQLFPTPDNRYQVAWYRLGPDHVMLVRGRVPKARYFGFTLYNAWLESLDYGRHRVVLNHAQIETGADGAFEICLARRNPGHPNWMDPAGHAAGYLVARSLLPEGELPGLEVEVLYERELLARRG